MKTCFLTVLFFSLFSIVRSQEHEFHNRVTSEVWETIAGIKHQVVDEYEYYPVFHEKLKALEGRTVSLKGYIVPITEGVSHSSFLLSVLPISQCFYCGKNGIPMMVEVKTKKPVRFTENIVTVKGIINLYRVNAAFACPVVIKQALVSE